MWIRSTKIKTIVLKEIYLRLIQHYACVTSEKRMKRDIITYVITQVCFQNKSFLPFYNDYYANVCINNITEIAYTLSNGFVSDPSNKMLLMIVVRVLWYDNLLLFSKLSGFSLENELLKLPPFSF